MEGEIIGREEDDEENDNGELNQAVFKRNTFEYKLTAQETESAEVQAGEVKLKLKSKLSEVEGELKGMEKWRDGLMRTSAVLIIAHY